MDVSTIKTIINIVPTEKPNERNYETHTFTPVIEERLSQEHQLKITDKDKTFTWIVDQVTPRFQDETATLIDSALSGYNATFLFLSVSDEYKELMYKQRQQNLKDIFDNLKLRIHNSNELVSIEYAYLGIKDYECYDFRKNVSRTSISVRQRGMDSFMKTVENIDGIISVMKKGPTMPSILNIKLKNIEKKTTGRLIIIDLLHPRFTPLLPGVTNPIHESFDYLQFIVDKLTSPNCTEILKTSATVLTNEITKYICGKSRLLVVGYINDKIVSKIHLNETKALLSFVSSFKDIPVRALPNKLVNETHEYKILLSEKKTIEHQNSELLSFNNTSQQQLLEKGLIVNDLEVGLNSLKSESTSNHSKSQSYKQKIAALSVKDKQIVYLKAVIDSKAPLYTFEKLKLKAEIARLKALMDIKEFAEENDVFESQLKRRAYNDFLSRLRDRETESEKEIIELETFVKGLQQKSTTLKTQYALKTQHASRTPSGNNQVAEELNSSSGPLNYTQTSILARRAEKRFKLEELEELEDTLRKRKRELEISELETEKNKKNLEAVHAKTLEKAEEDVIDKKAEVKNVLADLKNSANMKLTAINRKYQDKIAGQEREIKKLSAELLEVRRHKKKSKN